MLYLSTDYGTILILMSIFMYMCKKKIKLEQTNGQFLTIYILEITDLPKYLGEWGSWKTNNLYFIIDFWYQYITIINLKQENRHT